MKNNSSLQCPIPLAATNTIQLAHGAGGRQMRALIERTFMPAFANPALLARHDAAVVDLAGARIAFTTDSYVVSPLFFPGGDIGKLAVCGSVNDLAMAGARPSFLSAGFILEEGFPIEQLERIVASMRDAAAASGVQLVTGDTKVVDHGKADGMFINTAGIGLVPPHVEIAPARVRPGDAIILSGDIGRHGIAVMSVRQGLEFEGAIVSDCAPLAAPVACLLDAGIDVHCMRDLTRGGLASALIEIAFDGQVGIEINEEDIAISEPVSAACELLGLDPLYVANEGRFVAFVAEHDSSRALEILRGCGECAGAAIIGQTRSVECRRVVMRGLFGNSRELDLLTGEQLPRIC
jgi:hydrogenase expression/formation protein HypE